MTYTLTRHTTRYKNYRDYLDNCNLVDGNYRLLDTGEVIQLPPEDDDNIVWASELKLYLCQVPGLRKLVRGNDTEIQVHPEGDRRVNRKPDVMVLKPEHRTLFKENKCSAIKFGMPAPAFIAEIVSTGKESSENYKRDYIWKRKQYQWWGIPEYWIVDWHKEKVTVLTLDGEVYREDIFTGNAVIPSSVFPSLKVPIQNILTE